MPEDYTSSHYTEFCPACHGYGKIHYHDQPGDDEDRGHFLAYIFWALIAALTITLAVIWMVP